MVCESKEVELNVAPQRLWAAMKDGHNLLPKVMKDEVASIEHCEGEGKVGSVRKVHFVPDFAGKCGAKYIKEKLIHVDDAGRTIKFAAVEGGPIGTICNSLTVTTTFAPGKDESHTLAKLEAEYEPIKDADVSKMQEGSLNMIKKVAAYLHAHPNEYC